LAAAIAPLLAATVPAWATCGSPDGPVQVAAVDDRLDLVLADGRVVHIGGLEVPSYDRAPGLAGAAREFLARRLIGREVELDLFGKETDRWGRMVGDVSISEAAPGSEGSTAAALLAAGYAVVLPAVETRSCSQGRLATEDRARQSGLGVWRDRAYAVLDSADSESLRTRGGRFVVIEGMVHKVGFGRTRVYLGLGPRGGPIVVLPRKLEPALEKAGHPARTLVGRKIRVRGALDDRFGARLEVSEPAMIEVLSLRYSGSE
jgi:hypothetical protein